MTPLFRGLLVAALVLCLSRQGPALRCYICQSLNSNLTGESYNPAETDGMDHADCESDPFITNSGVPLATCNNTIHNACFKSHSAYIDLDPAKNKKTRIVVEVARLCGYAEDNSDRDKCRKDVGLDTENHWCYCSTDGCNKAATWALSLPAAGLALVVTTSQNFFR